VGKSLDKFFDWISVKKYSDQIPYNYIEEELKHRKRVPWVVKRKVLISKPDITGSDEIRYIEMKVPENYDRPFYVGSKETSTERERINSFSVVKEQTASETALMDVFFEPPAEKNTKSVENSTEVPIEYYECEDFLNKPLESEIDSNDLYNEVFNQSEYEKAESKPEDFTVNYSSYEIKQNRIYDINGEAGFSKTEYNEEPFDIIYEDHNRDSPEPDCEKQFVETGESDDNYYEEKEKHNIIDESESIALKRTEEVRKKYEPEVEDLRDNKVFTELNINREYIVPTAFLEESDPIDSNTMASEIKRNSELLVRTLADFGIESRVINVNRGPVITLYEMQIAAGIKITKVVGLSDDIAMALAAYRVRIVAPIPGKSAIGVELPNNHREMVTLGDIVKSEEYQSKRGSLKVGLGKDILGKPVTLDLKKQPHLLIAGATGSGKSVCVNSIITSIVYNYDPNIVRFIMVDPKMVELQLYNGMPHLLTPVITEPQIAPSVLKWAIFEMERRYRLLAAKNTRDIETYNQKVTDSRKGEEKLPFIVIIIDELADLMMVASKEIEGYITRIAQKARAIGIHLVLATQRPSVDVITGVIKANFPARIAFQVAQKTDSRTILDQNGAEKLLGKGDLLYQSPLTSYPVRIQGAFVSEDETVSVVEHLRTLGTPHYIDIEEALQENETAADLGEEEDEMFVEALKIIEETRKASASYLQRRLSIGYNRAARIIERMEDMGYVGPQQGSKPREVFI